MVRRRSSLALASLFARLRLFEQELDRDLEEASQ